MTKNTFEKPPQSAQEQPHTTEREKEQEIMRERLEQLMRVCPSQEMQKIKDALIDQLLTTDAPEEKFAAIEEIFIKNNLPPVGKYFRAFTILNPPEKMAQIMASRTDLSPCLREASPRKRYAMLYRDLLRVHIASNNRDLRAYLETFRDGQEVFDRIAAEGIASLTEAERAHAMRVCGKVMTLRDNARRGFRDYEAMTLEGDLEEQYAAMAASIGVAEGQSVTDRLSRMFLAPAGYASIAEALDAMDTAQHDGHQRGLETARQLQEGRFTVGDGDVLRGVNADDIKEILQGATVSRELFAPSSTEDASPYDYDVIRVGATPPHLDEVIRAYANPRGGAQVPDVFFLIRNRDQFHDTTTSAQDYTPDKMEIFARTTDRAHDQWGVRTGPSTSEIDVFIATDTIVTDRQKSTNFFFAIAQNGRYVPVTDTRGRRIFKPEDYAQYRRTFCGGVERYGGEALEVTPTVPEDAHYDEITQLRAEMQKDRAHVEQLQTMIRDAIAQTLAAHGVALHNPHDTMITGADLFTTGSTARGTNAPHDYDFDFTVRLDAADMAKAPEILAHLRETLGGEEIDAGSHAMAGEGIFPLRLRNVGFAGEASRCDVDVTIMPKSELLLYGSHDAAAERLAWIRDHVSQDAYEQTVANILLTKRFMKEHDVYLMWREHHPNRIGGIGGIGVENWILANGGNMLQAFRSFHNASHDAAGNRIPFARFREAYHVIDPGENFADNGMHNDYFGTILTERGYAVMCDAIEKYLHDAPQ